MFRNQDPRMMLQRRLDGDSARIPAHGKSRDCSCDDTICAPCEIDSEDTSVVAPPLFGRPRPKAGNEMFNRRMICPID